MNKVQFFRYHRSGILLPNKIRILGSDDYEKVFMTIIFGNYVSQKDISVFINDCITDPILSENSIERILTLFQDTFLLEQCTANPNVTAKFLEKRFIEPNTYMLKNPNMEVIVNRSNIDFIKTLYFSLGTVTNYSENFHDRVMTLYSELFPFWNPNLSVKFYDKYGVSLEKIIQNTPGLVSERLNAENEVFYRYEDQLDDCIFDNPYAPTDLLIERLGERIGESEFYKNNLIFMRYMRNEIFNIFIKNKSVTRRVQLYNTVFFSKFPGISKDNIRFLLNDLDTILDHIEDFLENDISNVLSNLYEILWRFWSDTDFIKYTVRMLFVRNITDNNFNTWFFENLICKDRVNRDLLNFFQVRDNNEHIEIKQTISIKRRIISEYSGETRLNEIQKQLNFRNLSPRFILASAKNIALFLFIYSNDATLEERYSDWAFGKLNRIDPLELKRMGLLIENRGKFTPGNSGYFEAKTDFEKNCKRIM